MRSRGRPTGARFTHAASQTRAVPVLGRKQSAPCNVLARLSIPSYAPARSRPEMKRRTIIILAAVFAVLSLGAMAATGKLGGKKTDGPKAVPVVRGTLVDKALAVGTIQPPAEA